MEVSTELEAVERHIEELKKLQDEYTEQINVMERQKNDFDVLINALEKEVVHLKGAERQSSLELVDSES
tara:strand:+ start:259 stop:465 length:207 start_codon:yes stop_codon:yes gene_type:complete